MIHKVDFQERRKLQIFNQQFPTGNFQKQRLFLVTQQCNVLALRGIPFPIHIYHQHLIVHFRRWQHQKMLIHLCIIFLVPRKDTQKLTCGYLWRKRVSVYVHKFRLGSWAGRWRGCGCRCRCRIEWRWCWRRRSCAGKPLIRAPIHLAIFGVIDWHHPMQNTFFRRGHDRCGVKGFLHMLFIHICIDLVGKSCRRRHLQKRKCPT